MDQAENGPDDATEEGGGPTVELPTQELDVEGLQGIDKGAEANQRHGNQVSMTLYEGAANARGLVVVPIVCLLLPCRIGKRRRGGGILSGR